MRSARTRFLPLGLAAALALAALASPACRRIGALLDGDRPIVAVVLSFTDANQGPGSEQLFGALRAGFRAEGGPSVEWTRRDDGGLPSRTAEEVRRLADEERLRVVVGGTTSPCALAAAERAEELHIPLVTPMATNDRVTANRDFVFRMCFTDSRQGEQMAHHAYGTLGLRRVVVVRDVTNDYSLGLAGAFAEQFLRLGGEITGVHAYRRGIDDAQALERWLGEGRADALYLPLYRTDIEDLVAKGTRLWGRRDLVLLGGDGWHSTALRTFLRQAWKPGWRLRIRITAHFPPPPADPPAPMRAFLEWWRRTQGPGRPTSAAALGWDTGRLIARALRDGARSREEVREALRASLAGFEGITGVIRIDETTGALVKDAHVLEWDAERGDWRAVE